MAEGVHATINQLSFSHNNYVLVIPGWYPTWLDPYPGDFNQRQVFAVGTYVPQLVLYIGRDPTGSLTETETRTRKVSSLITEIVVLYPGSGNWMFDPVKSNSIFFTLLFRYSTAIIKKLGKPLLIHSYIVIRGGLAGCLLAKQWSIPLVLTEHWTMYFSGDTRSLDKRNLIFRFIVKWVLRRVDRLLPVTSNLASQLHMLAKQTACTVTPNVVDTRLFFYREDKKPVSERFMFIHISTMEHQKNPLGILSAFNRLPQNGSGCGLLMVGPYPTEVMEFAKGLACFNSIRFTGAVTYGEVANLLRDADALVLFSRYENLPCVILEALCCGVPVISTDVGGISEVIDETNGKLVNNEDEAGLERAFSDIQVCYHRYHRERIALTASERFSYNVVGKHIKNVYEELLRRPL